MKTVSRTALRLSICCVLLLNMLFTFTGCKEPSGNPQVVATTLPVYEFTTLLCEGTNITTGQLIAENISCLHDYTLQVSQMRMLEQAELVVISGAGLDDFLYDVLPENRLDASVGIALHCPDHEHDHHGHSHEEDPHIWLSPERAKQMAQNICVGLSSRYPQYASTFEANLKQLKTRLDALQTYGEETLSNLSCREIITFHDGFYYFAESVNLTILRAVEEESGSEVSAARLIELIELVDTHDLPAIFIERNGGDAAASIICAETGVAVYTLDMVMSGSSYFDIMYKNIDTIKEALG